MAIGHSTVTFEGALDAAAAGARIVTHLFNGMGPLHHQQRRDFQGAALSDARLVPSLIADFVHVHPAMVKPALDARPMRSWSRTQSAPTRPTSRTEPWPARRSRWSTAVQNVVGLGIAPGRAVRHATGNPARELGLDDRGRVARVTR